MILTNHILTGALIALKIKFLPLALLFSFLSNYLLDFIPHREYSIKNIMEKNWGGSKKEFFHIFLDATLGFLLVFFLSKNVLLAIAGGFFAILPDILTLLKLIFPNKILNFLNAFHQKIHLFKNKTSLFWEISTQVIVFALVIYFFLQ